MAFIKTLKLEQIIIIISCNLSVLKKTVSFNSLFILHFFNKLDKLTQK